jgi:CheY-like chemotaxis protein
MKRVLIIDDEVENQSEAILNGFAGSQTEVILCATKDEGLKWIKSKALFDCIVLDWFLEEHDSSILSKQILAELNGKYYAPVMIYSHHADDFRQELESGNISYPKNLIREFQKDNFSEINSKIDEWLNSEYTARLSNIYLNEVYDKIHKTFWSLNEIKGGNIAAIYKSIIFENGNIDWSNDFIINILLQSVTTDKFFRDSVKPLIDQVQAVQLQTTPDDKRKVINKILYYKASPEFLSNGDIVKINSGEQSCYGFIATPDCDLSQGNTRYIEFIKLVKFQSVQLGNTNNNISEGKSSNHFFLPAIQEGKELIDLVAVFKANHFITAKNNSSDKYPGVANRVKYADTFIYNNTDCALTYICSLVNPYKSELLQKRISHNSRVGIPSVYEYLKGN